MIHPSTELRLINEHVGYGVFATAYIPKGTITFVQDLLDSVISPQNFLDLDIDLQRLVEKYSYKDEKGNRIVSWDFAKYINHCCNCNTISTGYGFEIAIRDIEKGEQLTDEYGIFNLDEEMILHCEQPGCRKVLKPEDFDTYYMDWDAKILTVIGNIQAVDQPLISFLPADIKEELNAFLADSSKYKSVYSLRYFA